MGEVVNKLRDIMENKNNTAVDLLTLMVEEMAALNKKALKQDEKSVKAAEDLEKVC